MIRYTLELLAAAECRVLLMLLTLLVLLVLLVLHLMQGHHILYAQLPTSVEERAQCGAVMLTDANWNCSRTAYCRIPTG